MVRSPSNSLAILRFWRDIEFFMPFDLDDVLENERAIKLNLLERISPPWIDRELYSLNPEREYAFDIFFSPFSKSEVPRRLSTIFPEINHEAPEDPREYRGLSCLARFSVSDIGILGADDPSISTLPWALECVCRNLPLSLVDFDNHIEARLNKVEEVVSLANNENDEDEENIPSAEIPLTFDMLVEISKALSADLSLSFFPENLFAVVVPYIVARRKQLKAADSRECANGVAGRESKRSGNIKKTLRSKRRHDILNSFYLRDLERVNSCFQLHAKEAPSCITQYLEAVEDHTASRIDILSESGREVVENLLAADCLPSGRWLSSATQRRSLNQDLALRSYFSRPAGLFSSNGPPGTGKSTLVRDLIAKVVVERATHLADLKNPRDAFFPGEHSAAVGQRSLRFRTLKPELCGHEIIIASSNNKAVENISKQIPLTQSLGEEFQSFRYLLAPAMRSFCARLEDSDDEDLSRHPVSTSIWGIPSVALGNARNRNGVRKALFFPPPDEPEDDRIRRIAQGDQLSLFEWRNHSYEGVLSFQAAKRAFIQALESVATDRASNSERSKVLMARDQPLCHATNQLVAPGQDDGSNQLESVVFKAALALHEAWVREAPQLEMELRAISTLLKNPTSFSGDNALVIWQIFFMIVPVMSTTLASVERMFAVIQPNAFGHVIIDEAGQATPQSLAGILMRSKRALLIGDQRQLEPVVVTPSALEAWLARLLTKKVRMLVSPLFSSALSLADQRSELGTFWGERADRVWVSTPLVVHRRCSDPMFIIANSIAYGDRMIQGGSNNPGHSPAGKSSWIQISGSVTSKQYVPEQARVAANVLKTLVADAQELPDVFIISPFREVRDRLAARVGQIISYIGLPERYRKELRARIGTVHAFQGREANIVLFVLGCDFSTTAAADWAGERPNLVNVAVTRARNFLYVIGDVNVWHNRGYFSDLEKALPKRIADDFAR